MDSWFLQRSQKCTLDKRQRLQQTMLVNEVDACRECNQSHIYHPAKHRRTYLNIKDTLNAEKAK